MHLNCRVEKTLDSPLDCKEIQPVHPKGDQSWVFIEGLMLKLKLQYFGYLMQSADSFEKTLMLGKIEGRRRGWQRMRWWLDGITDSIDMSLSKLRVDDGQGGLACCSPWSRKESDGTELLNWTECYFNNEFLNCSIIKSIASLYNKSNNNHLVNHWSSDSNRGFIKGMRSTGSPYFKHWP